MYRSRGILLLGIKSKNIKESVQYDFHEIFLNPIDYMISSSDEGIVLARN